MMFIDAERKIMFIHVPKCGGRTIARGYRSEKMENAIVMRGINGDVVEEVPMHVTAKALRTLAVPVDDYKVFAVVRNPWNWLVSIYLYCLLMPELWQRGAEVSFPRGIKKSDGETCDIERCWRSLVFAEFKDHDHVGGFTKFLCYTMQWIWNPFPCGNGQPLSTTSQVDWVRDVDGAYILRLEDMNDHLPKMLGEWGVDFEWPEKKVAEFSAYDYRAYYSDKTRKWVQRIHRDTIEAFGYEF